MRRKQCSEAEPAARQRLGPETHSPLAPMLSHAAGFAAETLANLILTTLASEGRLQLETLFSTLGALAGFACQYAVRRECVVEGGMAERDAFLIVVSDAGERFYLGDRVNALLINQRAQALSVLSVVSGEAMRLGVKSKELPNLAAIFDHVAGSLGAPDFGVADLPLGRRPWVLPKEAVAAFWSASVAALVRDPEIAPPGGEPLPPKLWPLCFATIAASFLNQFDKHIAPALAVRVFMEAAIAMSQIDPACVTAPARRLN